MAEFLRPDADVSIGGWTTQTGGTTNLFDALNESSPDDADYIISSPDPVADIYRFRISDPSSIMDDGTVRYRYEKIGSGIGDLIARLIQGNNPTTFWNSADKTANITLSGSDLIATISDTSFAGVRTVGSYSAGKKYVELTLTNGSGSTMIFGISNSSHSFAGLLGSSNNGIGWFTTGQVYLNNSLVDTIASYSASGETLCLAIDFDNEKFWGRPASDPDWNDDVLANENPATNTGGVSFATMAAGPYFATFMANIEADKIVTLNTGMTPYAGTKPVGYTNWSSGGELEVAEWEHTDIAASFVTAAQTLTTPQFDSITDFDDLFGELEANSGVAAYDPSADAGLVAWWKADDTAAGKGPKDPGGINVPDNGEAVWYFEDSGPNSYGLMRAAAGDLLYETNSLNGRPGVVFDAAQNTGLRSVNDEILLNSTTLTVIVLVKSLTGADSNARFFSLIGSAAAVDYDNNKSCCIVQPGGTTEQVYTYGNNAQTGTGSNSAFAFGTARTIALKYDGTECQRWIAGVEQGTGTAWTTALGNTVCEYVSLMSRFDGGENAEGTLYEVIFTTTVLDLSLGGDVDTYIFNKWGVH